jgi:hypothetical protein
VTGIRQPVSKQDKVSEESWKIKVTGFGLQVKKKKERFGLYDVQESWKTGPGKSCGHGILGKLLSFLVS